MKGFIVHIVYKEEDAEKCLMDLRLWANTFMVGDEPDCVKKFAKLLREELENPRPIR